MIGHGAFAPGVGVAEGLDAFGFAQGGADGAGGGTEAADRREFRRLGQEASRSFGPRPGDQEGELTEDVGDKGGFGKVAAGRWLVNAGGLQKDRDAG